MTSLYLQRLTPEQRRELVHSLWEQQNHKSFISGKEIDLEIHKG